MKFIREGSHYLSPSCIQIQCFVLNNETYNIGKFDAKTEEGLFIRYSTSSKVFGIYNKNHDY